MNTTRKKATLFFTALVILVVSLVTAFILTSKGNTGTPNVNEAPLPQTSDLSKQFAQGAATFEATMKTNNTSSKRDAKAIRSVNPIKESGTLENAQSTMKSLLLIVERYPYLTESWKETFATLEEGDAQSLSDALKLVKADADVSQRLGELILPNQQYNKQEDAFRRAILKNYPKMSKSDLARITQYLTQRSVLDFRTVYPCTMQSEKDCYARFEHLTSSRVTVKVESLSLVTLATGDTYLTPTYNKSINTYVYGAYMQGAVESGLLNFSKDGKKIVMGYAQSYDDGPYVMSSLSDGENELRNPSSEVQSKYSLMKMVSAYLEAQEGNSHLFWMDGIDKAFSTYQDNSEVKFTYKIEQRFEDEGMMMVRATEKGTNNSMLLLVLADEVRSLNTSSGIPLDVGEFEGAEAEGAE